MECLTVFSCKDMVEVESLGGVGWFRLRRARVEACRYVIIFHNSLDLRKPGDRSKHRFPVLLAKINGTHVDPVDGRIAVRVSHASAVSGPQQESCGRSPVGYANASLVEGLEVEGWREISPSTLEEALADRASWDARHRKN